jgi:cysteine desulfurase
MRKVYYFDNNATTQVDKRVLKEMEYFLKNNYANPSSIYKLAQEARGAIEKAREQVAKLLNAEPDEIIFTSGGTESNNTVIKGVALALKDKGKHIITTQIEHHAVLNPCKFLEIQGYDVTYLTVDGYGMIDLKELENSIRKDTILISIIFANNEIGTIQNIEEIGKIARKYNIYFHTDAVQAVGKIPIDVKRLNIDFLSLSGHKLYGPKGIGALYSKKGVKFISLLHGGEHEKHRRAGTENVAGIVGLGKACEIALNEMEKEAIKIKKLKEKLENFLRSYFKDIKINGHPSETLYNTLNFSLPDVNSQDILILLDQYGFCASAGSACSAGIPEPSHVLKAIKLPEKYLKGTIRISLGKFNTEKEINKFIEIFPDIIKKLKNDKS